MQNFRNLYVCRLFKTVTTGGPWNLYTAQGAWTRLTCGGCPSEANVKYGCFPTRCGCLSPRPVSDRESLCYCYLGFRRQGMHSVFAPNAPMDALGEVSY